MDEKHREKDDDGQKVSKSVHRGSLKVLQLMNVRLLIFGRLFAGKTKISRDRHPLQRMLRIESSLCRFWKDIGECKVNEKLFHANKRFGCVEIKCRSTGDSYWESVNMK